jgi:hypothetical protein
MTNEYLVAPHGHGNFDEHLAQFDELQRQGDLAKLKDKIQVAIDKYFEYGQFEVWWNNRMRTNTIQLQYVPIMTFIHNDDLLLALLRCHRHCRSSDQRVENAWQNLVYKFRCDRDEEDWRRTDWQPSDERGPHRP